MLSGEYPAVSGDQWLLFGKNNDTQISQPIRQTITVVEGRLRQFWGDSFNVSAGLGGKSHQLRSTQNLTNVGNASLDGISASGTGIVAGLSIGNQVQRDKVTLGCDWIGAYRVLKMLDHSETEVLNSDPLAADKRDYLSRFRQSIKADNLSVFRVHFGLVF